MPIRFDVEDGAIFVRPSDLAIREFMALYEADKTKPKTEAQQHLMFVYHFCDTRSEFFDTDETEKMAACKANAYGVSDYAFNRKWAPLVEAAMAKYEELNETAPLRAVQTINRKIDQIRRIIDATVPIIDETEEKDKSGKVVRTIKPNVNNIIKASIDLDKMAETSQNMYQRAMTGGNKTKNRGDKQPSLLESGKLGIVPVKQS